MTNLPTTLDRPVVSDPPRIDVRNQWWILIVIGALVVVINLHNRWLLNYYHVFFAVLWTGTDLYMGFILGPLMRRLEFSARRALILRLMPRMIFYMPTVAAVTTTSGWFLAEQLGYWGLPFPPRGWLLAAGVIVVVLTIQGLGVLLPINLKVYFELRKEEPDGQRVQRLMQTYVKVVAVQALMQFGIVLVMARIATGF